MKLHALSPLERQDLIKQYAKSFSERAKQHDEEQSFPFENIEELKMIGYTSLSLPKTLGGQGIPLTEWLKLQELIATADGSTSLSIGWHMGIVSELNQKNWPDSVLTHVTKKISQNGFLLNTAATEPDTGSPTRGGKPTTQAKKVGSDWVLSGRKSFTSMVPALDFILVSASMDDDQVGYFLIEKGASGVRVEETWNTIAMRGTASHDLILENVKIPHDHLVELVVPGKKSPSGWLLHIPACYLGIAQAAQTEAVSFASTYSPNSLPGPIKDIPAVQSKIGENEADLIQARYLLYGVSAKWDAATDEERLEMQSELGVAKYHVVNAAQKIVDRAMRVVGAQSLFTSNPLQRYYRDVRAGLHNPPMDDRTLVLLAQSLFN
ncbi:acyl-CoA dehydrogenase family protein [Bacillus suaedae]|uniref:Acyl-CoA/acyl-ACP dehydrogenase n=1 Tax=Halalkalibacter suaedae TaxID=2822140 RepID=A0A940WR92_9BACI|nr:acyl-CoA dehydrogenase family protein [Bacillus suaedae]MBP3951050.1 acyl-CoA/acyl-ACP dehydrogenase [Bacillus suaedae]